MDNTLKKIFDKQGGFQLIKRYAEGGALFTAIIEFILLGKSRTSLEILRLAANLKVKNKLRKKYDYVLNDFEKNWSEKEHLKSDKVWICWFQGIENAPDIVKVCYDSVKRNISNKDIVLITEENILEYADFPEFIIDKWKAGIITDTHMTDLLRLELLIKQGGTWIDATVLCTGELPNYMTDSDLFLFQSLKPGRDGKAVTFSSWFMSAKNNNKILLATQALLYEYWNKNNQMIDYFLLHDFLQIVLDRYPEYYANVIPFSNSTPHILLLRLFEKYDDVVWQAVIAQSPIHKLSYKFDKTQSDMSGTYFKYILNNMS